VESLRVLSLAGAQASLSITLRLSNPNNFDLVAKSVDFEVTLDGRRAASVHSVHLDPLPAGGEAKVELAGHVDVAAIATALMSFGSRLPVEYAITGTATLQDGTALAFSHKGEIPVARFDRALGTRP
jgi:LEA14-like dessication related protein